MKHHSSFICNSKNSETTNVRHYVNGYMIYPYNEILPSNKANKICYKIYANTKKKNGLWSHSKTKSTYIVIPFKYVIRNANWLRESRSMATYGPGSWDGWEEGISQKVAWGSFAVTWIYHVFSLRWLSHPTHVNLI